MRRFINRTVLALVIASLASFAVLAKTRKHTVTFLTDINVGGTLVKKGVYSVKFDDKTGELSILDGKKVIAKAPTTAEKRERKARDFTYKSRGGDVKELLTVTFEGSDQDLTINSSAASR
jgi:hypothetical protein